MVADGAPLLDNKNEDSASRNDRRARTDASGVSIPAPLSSRSSKDMWLKASHKVMHAVRVKHKLVNLHGLARDTALMRSLKTEAEKTRYIIIIMVMIVVLGALTAMTKSAIFHMNSTGRWDDGHSYKFSYALSLTMIVFIFKVLLVFVRVIYQPEDKEDAEQGDAEDEEDEVEETCMGKVMPWLLLVSFTFFEMLSATTASLGLLYGAPTSMFVVFKSSKTIFLAIMSVIILRRRLNCAQWSALGLITLALVIATIAEGKGGKKGGGDMNLMGPALLLLSELFHATMLVLQEIAVREYWPEPLALLSSSAVIGCILTGIAMLKASQIMVPLPDGGFRPASDPYDSMLMCLNNPILGFTLLLHLATHVSSDVSHIVILKHISALARTLCDAVKLILMWLLGKAFWAVGIFPVLAEAWHPGLIGSWLMLPAILVIIYAMMMFKDATFTPIKFVKQGGQWGIEQVSKKEENVAHVKVNLEDPFYVSMFRSQKLQHNVQRSKSMANGLVFHRAKTGWRGSGGRSP